MQIGNETVLLEKGMIQVIPSMVPHSAVAHEDCILIDVFNPVREDYRKLDYSALFFNIPSSLNALLSTIELLGTFSSPEMISVFPSLDIPATIAFIS